MMADTDEKINKCIEKSLNYLSAIGRPIVLKCEQRISIQHLLLAKDVIAILPTGFGKSMIFTVYTLAKVSWFSKANTLVWTEPCARWAELKMLSFWAGGISSFPPCAREYRLLRRLNPIRHWLTKILI